MRRSPACSPSQMVRPALAASLAFWLLLLFAATEQCRAAEESSVRTGPGVLQLQHRPGDKRAAAPLYGFGLGKRSPLMVMGDEAPAADPAALDVDEDEEDEAMAEPPSRYLQEKRGPRDSMRYGFGLGKRWGGGHERGEYAPFDAEKRERTRFSFGLGKRDKKSKLEDFMKRRYNFGLGKRGIYGDADAGERWKRSLK